MKACLRSRDGSCVHQLRQPLTTIGCEGSDVIIQCSNIERQHAVIEYNESEGCFVVQDLNSAHGTYVNECRVQNAAVRLASGDVIRFGYGNTGFEFLVDSSSPMHYPSLSFSKPWESYRLRVLSSQSAGVTSLPYITTTTPTSSEGMSLYPSSQAVSLPGTWGPSMTELRGTSDPKTSVMPHPPLRSRPTSAGSTKARPSSAGRERSAVPPVSRGGWVNGPIQTGEQTAQELEERLLRMGDELSRLASYEAECHRKDGVIAALRDEVVDLKGALQSSGGFRPGGEDSAFSNSSIILQLREQVSQLQGILQEKEESEKTAAQKLAMYQNQLHAKNNEVSTLKDQLQAQPKATTWVKTDPNATTNKIASLRTEIAEKERRIAQLTNDNEKLNKQKMQSTTLLNGLQRENSAKDALVHQAKTEIEKLKKELREKDSTISTMSTKLGRQKAAKDAEKEVQKLQQELYATTGKLQSTEKQLKERIKTIADLEHELEKMRGHLSEGRQSDKATQQELDHAKAQCLDAQRAEKLLKVDFHQMEKRFDRFRRKLIEYTFSGGVPSTVDHELEDDELLDHVRQLAHDKLSLVEEIQQYASSESEKEAKDKDLRDSTSELRKHLDGMAKRLWKSGRTCSSLEEELTLVEELTTHDSLAWIKDFVCKMLSNEAAWQQKAEEALKHAADDSDSETSVSVEDLCRQLRDQKEECRKLKGKVAEMEETHQEVLLKVREDMKIEEEKHISRAVAEVRSEEDEKQQAVIQEMKQKERERIQAAVDAERRILESQHGSVTQLQQVLNDRMKELENHRVALATAKSQYEQAKDGLQRAKETENHLRTQLHEQAAAHKEQLTRVEREKEDLKNYKEQEVASFKEQTRQHAVTIVAMEERLLRLTRQNRQLEQDAMYSKQITGRSRPSSPRKEISRPSSPKKEPVTSSRPQSPRKDPKPQTRSVETETVPQTSVEATLQSDIYKLEQLVLLLRREAAQAKKEAESQGDVVQALRRDLAGAAARMSDMAGELSDKQKQKLEQYEERIRDQDSELEGQRKQLMQLSALVDEQQKEINSREDKLTEQQKAFLKQKRDTAKKGTELIEYKEQLATQIEEQEEKLQMIERENLNTSELHAQGLRCRGERHDLVIARQKEALADFRDRTKTLEQLKPPLPNHEQALQQIVALKKEVSELRAKLASQEEDYHKSEGEMHAELRIRREQASSSLAETEGEKGAHRQTKEALDLSEKTYLKLARTLGALLEIDPVPGCRSMAHLPVEERERLELERTKAVELMVSKVQQMYERMERKVQLLGSYEDDLVHLRKSETMAGQKTAEATGLKMDVRNRQEEISYLRASMTRLRDELDQQRRLNVCLKERKKFAMDMDERDTKRSTHSCYMDEHMRYKEALKKKKAAEKLKRKNYEIESLKKELISADRELNETAVKLQLLESSRNLTSARSAHSEDSVLLDYDE
ncbi:forkhead-associated domain-containing protein 1-like isoform X1 [Orbicella faveolata]|uniref:forkhead-associated domain-containing protein 1-like isoform X1 n=2 Tax=Orbicella faveolata TaxID=48498 RepID=UPI0009E35A09|nr:forkhead-associated domain-containing protein 1-like isoform X1 [Orbicella faveolata]